MKQSGAIPVDVSARKGEKRGRKLHYSDQQLLGVWLYVQVGMARTGLSALQFCKKQSFSWIRGGQHLPPEPKPRGTGRTVIDHVAHGETLRRRYQAAVAFLRTESAPYGQLWELGYRSKAFGRVSPTEAWWWSELELALARK